MYLCFREYTLRFGRLPARVSAVGRDAAHDAGVPEIGLLRETLDHLSVLQGERRATERHVKVAESSGVPCLQLWASMS